MLEMVELPMAMEASAADVIGPTSRGLLWRELPVLGVVLFALMELLGFGFVGAAMRRPRQRQEVRVRYS